MAKYSLLILLVLTHLNSAFGQGEDLPLVFSETYEYLQQDGEQLKKTTLTDLTGGKPVEIIIWTIKTVTEYSERTQKSGIVDGDTLTEISIRQFDNLGNTILVVDSSNNRLTRRIEYKYEDSLKVSSSEFSNLDPNWDPTTSEKSYFYENGQLVKTIEKEKGDDLIGLLSDEDERTYYDLFEYENGLLSREISLSDKDTISVTTNTYNINGNIVMAESEDSLGDKGLSTWEYDIRVIQ